MYKFLSHHEFAVWRKYTTCMSLRKMIGKEVEGLNMENINLEIHSFQMEGS